MPLDLSPRCYVASPDRSEQRRRRHHGSSPQYVEAPRIPGNLARFPLHLDDSGAQEVTHSDEG